MVFADEHSIRIRGHSGYADEGKDIVCAAVSALFQNTVKSLHDLTDDKVSISMESGNGTIEYEDLSERGELLIDSFFIGICMITEQYLQYVRIV